MGLLKHMIILQLCIMNFSACQNNLFVKLRNTNYIFIFRSFFPQNLLFPFSHFPLMEYIVLLSIQFFSIAHVHKYFTNHIILLLSDFVLCINISRWIYLLKSMKRNKTWSQSIYWLSNLFLLLNFYIIHVSCIFFIASYICIIKNNEVLQ